MVTVLALVVDHVSVELWPLVIDVGLAEKLAVGSAPAAPTVMFSEAFAGTLPLLSQNWTTT
jgi:hypothetical protein